MPVDGADGRVADAQGDAAVAMPAVPSWGGAALLIRAVRREVLPPPQTTADSWEGCEPASLARAWPTVPDDLG
jgi:hypothetical protein